MKKMMMVFMLSVAPVFLAAGCSLFDSKNKSAPGSVIGSPSGGSDSQKVVTFYVVGKGLEPETSLTKGEAVIMAERAAVADGYRQLAEKIKGVYVDAFMKAGNGTINRETIQLHTQAWLRGAEVTELSQGDYGITRARMRLRINFSKKGMVWWPMGLGEDLKPVSGSSGIFSFLE